MKVDSLADSERQFRSVFYEAADAMLILDDATAVVAANRAACALFAVEASAIVSRPLASLIADAPEHFEAEWRELLALGEAKREHFVRSHGGVMRFVECSYRANVHANRHLCIARDVTDRRLLQERLAQSDKMESVGRLAGGIAHDFNNLLTAILGYTELLLSQRPPEDPDRADLEEIQHAGLRAASLTQQLLAFSRRQVLLPKDVDLNEAVSSLQAMLARLIREDIALSCGLSPEPAVVRIDPAQVEQLLLNLVLNARDALPSGGHIRIEVARAHRSQVELPAGSHAGAERYVRLRVSDDGTGIPPEARAHLFEPFYTTKGIGKGSGLGLAAVYGIVRQSHGFISVDSQPGRGATFTMHFPEAPPTPRDGVPPAARSTRRETILLVEDEDAVRAVISTVLRRNGYNVLEAATSRAASQAFEEHVGVIDLLVTDVVMPEMSGPVLARRFVARRPDLPVLFISGYADVATPFDAEKPNVEFLRKPFEAAALAGKVRTLLTGAMAP